MDGMWDLRDGEDRVRGLGRNEECGDGREVGEKGYVLPRADHLCKLRRNPLTLALDKALPPELRVSVGL